jgi:hypothetical protein
MCREGQRRDVKAVIIADKGFPGDSEAFKIKERRGKEETWLRVPFKAVDDAMVQDAWERVGGLEGNDDVFNQWRRAQSEKERIRRVEQRRDAEQQQFQQTQATANAIVAGIHRERAGASLDHPLQVS